VNDSWLRWRRGRAAAALAHYYVITEAIPGLPWPSDDQSSDDWIT
jgi:hypothetical protein